MPERDDVALAVAAARWLGWDVVPQPDTYPMLGRWDMDLSEGSDCHAHLLSALLANHAEGIRVRMEIAANGWCFATVWARGVVGDHFRADEASPLVPLLRALDAAGVLPEAGGGA